MGVDRVRYQMSQPAAPQRDTVAVKDIVAEVAAGLDQPLQESIRVLRSVWPKLVGASIALQSEPGFIKEGTLYFCESGRVAFRACTYASADFTQN